MPTITTRSRKVPTAAEVSATDRWASDYIAENGIEIWRRMYTKGWTTKASDSYLEDHGLFDDQAFQALISRRCGPCSLNRPGPWSVTDHLFSVGGPDLSNRRKRCPVGNRRSRTVPVHRCWSG